MSEKKPEIHRMEEMLITTMKADVDELARRFCTNPENQPAAYDMRKFADLFLAADFSTIFIGRLATTELVEFSENLLAYSASYFLSGRVEGVQERSPYIDGVDLYAALGQTRSSIPSYLTSCHSTYANVGYQKEMEKQRVQRSFQERLFGIFMTYCLYFLQPAQYVRPIRVSVQQYRSINTLISDVLMPSEQFEATFCLFRLVESHAFAVMAFECEYNPLLNRHLDVMKETAASKTSKTLGFHDNDLHHLRTIRRDVAKADLIHTRYLSLKLEVAAQLSAQPKNSTGVVVSKTVPDQTLSSFVVDLIQQTEERIRNERLQGAGMGVGPSTSGTADLSAASANAERMSRKSAARHAAYTSETQQKRDRRHRQRVPSEEPKHKIQSPVKMPTMVIPAIGTPIASPLKNTAKISTSPLKSQPKTPKRPSPPKTSKSIAPLSEPVAPVLADIQEPTTSKTAPTTTPFGDGRSGKRVRMSSESSTLSIDVAAKRKSKRSQSKEDLRRLASEKDTQAEMETQAKFELLQKKL